MLRHGLGDLGLSAECMLYRHEDLNSIRILLEPMSEESGMGAHL